MNSGGRGRSKGLCRNSKVGRRAKLRVNAIEDSQTVNETVIDGSQPFR
jgi:hypothetical protein